MIHWVEVFPSNAKFVSGVKFGIERVHALEAFFYYE